MVVVDYALIAMGMIAAIWILNGFASRRRPSVSYEPFFAQVRTSREMGGD